ncbi:flavin monoamine oxidase family protein [Silvibacterium acidisoli]|uniref:flavin monoamine oxidase family protein n=1 Tax=Acidobacteriaceae bacterium ZG23-2 TaxID=2883246 RepID=UPI00406D35AE
MALTRRTFLSRIAQAGGLGAAYVSMRALGVIPAASLEAETIKGDPATGRGVKVVILGGGISGLVAAYELRALGYHCTVLEALSRPGGRNWTIRGGDEVAFTDGTTQRCSFDAGHYQNVGPARLPSNHRTMLGYCRKLGIPLEVEVNTSRSTRLQNDAVNGGKPIVQRQAMNDTRGHVAELLEKALRSGELDQELSKEDVERMLAFLKSYGPLTKDGRYVGSERAGYATDPGAGEDDGLLSKPLSMHTLLDGHFWNDLLAEESYAWQATMFQPVGGMDSIPHAFARELGKTVQYNSVVTRLEKMDHGVRATYTQKGHEKTLEADYCFTSMPLHLLRKIPNNLSAPYKKVIDECDYDGYCKIAWESRRFWEQDENIYGGLEYVEEGLSPVWLPSADFFTDRGVLLSGYGAAKGTPLDRMSLPEKFEASRASVEKLHPGHGKELEKPVYIGWHLVPHLEGSWINSYGPHQPQREDSDAVGTRRGGDHANAGYRTLLQPDGSVYFIGDYVSYLVGWQEGAALSSLRAIRMLNERIAKNA